MAPALPVVDEVDVPLVAGVTRRFAIVATLVMSPRTSIVVSRFGSFAIPPGTRWLSAETTEMTSSSVSPAAESLAGSTLISYAGVTSPPTLTYETPEICSIRGTMTLSA